MMSEWHITPDYIVNNWTDELLTLMIEKLVERKEMRKSGQESQKEGMVSDNSVSIETLSAMSSGMVKVVKQSGD